MRLINCETLELEEFFGRNTPEYAILSHTWGKEEVTFAHLPLHQASTKTRQGYRKIEYTCQQALNDGLHYAWVDTCCIDKSSSAELSEAINSMYAWYKHPSKCYAILEDVLKADFRSTFPGSRWFTRGWTLQELLAPKEVRFFDQRWECLGNRSEHARMISEITSIDIDLLLPWGIIFLSDCCIAKRMSWAADRETTRVEDEAYCLLGIFGIHMPLLYGEGEKAFVRLQEEIMKVTDDHSILAWSIDKPTDETLDGILEDHGDLATQYSLLAKSPSSFKGCGDMKRSSHSLAPFAMTNMGLKIRLPLVSMAQNQDGFNCYAAILNCAEHGSRDSVIAILLGEKSEEYGNVRASERALDGSPQQKRRSSDRFMTRICWSTNIDSLSTMPVDIGLASECHGQDVIIGSRREPHDKWDCYFINMMEENTIASGNGWWVDGIDFYPIFTPMDSDFWLPESAHFTVPRNAHKQSLLSFVVYFCNNKLIVFVAPKLNRTVVRTGSMLVQNDRELSDAWEYLPRDSPHTKGAECIVADDEERQLKITASVTQKTLLYDSQFFDVNIHVALCHQ